MAANTKRALVVEDEANIAELITLYLEKDGFDVRTASDGLEGLKAVDDFNPTIILLDIMLPKMDGVSLLKRLREERIMTPVIFLTAKGEQYDKVSGLDLGADDYVTKPFQPKELVARIHAVLRRAEGSVPAKERKLDFDKLTINMDTYELIINGQKVDAPPKEMELLFHLAASPNRVFTRNQLLDEVWGFDYFGDSRTVDVHIKRLREKLEGVSNSWAVKTVWGVGYKFETTG
ncbi:MAG: response regulator transcription factor [Oscillospiraceae bacterium]|jgi:DNA-binding response OmpR family regulator|nr:response regulator transcription factor [Oscillospiraceae bacterium]